MKPGGFAKTAIVTGLDEHAATVPLESLVSFAGVSKIFLVVDGHAKEVPVTLGVQGTEWVEIASPALGENAQVVTSGQTAIADGTAVAVRMSPLQNPSHLTAESGEAKSPDLPATPVARKGAIP